MLLKIKNWKILHEFNNIKESLGSIGNSANFAPIS